MGPLAIRQHIPKTNGYSHGSDLSPVKNGVIIPPIRPAIDPILSALVRTTVGNNSAAYIQITENVAETPNFAPCINHLKIVSIIQFSSSSQTRSFTNSVKNIPKIIEIPARISGPAVNFFLPSLSSVK